MMQKKYIETWKKYNPDYKIIEWNESNFDVNCCEYIRDAYKEKNGRLCQIMPAYMPLYPWVEFIWTQTLKS